MTEEKPLRVDITINKFSSVVLPLAFMSSSPLPSPWVPWWGWHTAMPFNEGHPNRSDTQLFAVVYRGIKSKSGSTSFYDCFCGYHTTSIVKLSLNAKFDVRLSVVAWFASSVRAVREC